MLRHKMIHEWQTHLDFLDPSKEVLCSGFGDPVDLPDMNLDDQAFFKGHCLRERGMVHIHTDGRRAIVTWDLQCSLPEAIEQAREWIEEHHTGQVVLRFRYAGLRIEKHDSVKVAVDRMGKLVWYKGVPVTSRATMTESTDFQSNTTAIRRGLEISDGAESVIDLQALLPYLLLWRRCEKTGSYIREHVGRKSGGALFWGDDWRSNAVGHEYDMEDPGEDFSNCVTEKYARVLDGGDPEIDHFYGLIFNDRDGGVWVPYQRLLFRTQLRDGRPCLACLSDLTPHVNIPLLPSPIVDLAH